MPPVRAWRSSRRERFFARARRWVTLGLVAWLTLVLSGREHALAAVGVHLACLHPDVVEAQRADDRAAGVEGEGSAPDDDCPPGCPDCACGASTFVPSTPPASIARRSWSERAFHRLRPVRGPSRSCAELERPPRRA